jgi:hypothetical protein
MHNPSTPQQEMPWSKQACVRSPSTGHSRYFMHTCMRPGVVLSLFRPCRWLRYWVDTCSSLHIISPVISSHLQSISSSSYPHLLESPRHVRLRLRLSTSPNKVPGWTDACACGCVILHMSGILLRSIVITMCLLIFATS